MAVEVGQLAQGTVIRLLPYGVLVRLDDGTTGLVHISEIDQNYVRDVADYFQLNDPVTVRVLRVDDRGKVELSAKQARGEGEPSGPRYANQNGEGGEGAPPRGEGGGGGGSMSRREARASFDEKMREFMAQSGERQADLKRNIENKRGGQKRR